MCMYVSVCGPDRLCWVMNLLPSPVSTNPTSDRHTHIQLARKTAAGGVFHFGDSLYVNS